MNTVYNLSSFSIRQNVSVQTLRVLPHRWQRTFLPGLLDLVGSCRQVLLISSDELISSPARSPQHAGTGGGVAAPPAAAPATGPPLPTGNPWRLSESRGVGPVKVLQEGWVSKVGMGDPRPVLRPIPYPVHQVVEPPTAAAASQDPVDLPVQVAPLEGVRGRGRRGRWRETTGGHRLDLGNMKNWMDLEGGGGGLGE